MIHTIDMQLQHKIVSGYYYYYCPSFSHHHVTSYHMMYSSCRRYLFVALHLQIPHTNKYNGETRQCWRHIDTNKHNNKIIPVLFSKAGLEEVSQLYETSNAILVLCEVFLKGVHDKTPLPKIISNISTIAMKKNIPNTEILDALLSSIVMLGMVDQLIQYQKVFAAFTPIDCDKMKFILSLQKLCLENPDFKILFPQIINIFYQGEIVSLDVVNAWMDEERSKNGNSFCFEQVKALFQSVSN